MNYCGKHFWKFTRKLNIELPYDSAIPLLGIDPERVKVETQTDTCTPVSMAALLTIAERCKQLKCSLTNKWINKCVVYIQWNMTQPEKARKF